MQNHVQAGDRLTVTAPATVSSGDFVKVGMIGGVALHDAASGADVVIATRGVFTLPKTSALAISIGDSLYWDTGEAAFNKTAASNFFYGHAVSAASNPSSTVQVYLSGQFPEAAGA
jgi:predicted RecA/RadA family phage recombinase